MDHDQISQILEMSDLPAFYVMDGVITHANQAALARMVPLQEPVAKLLETGAAEYAAFSGGCLCLSLRISNALYNALVKPLDGHHLFQLELGHDGNELKPLALAAQELRTPLERILANTESLFPRLNPVADSEEWHQMAQITRSLYQLHRLVGNMSDASSLSMNAMELQDVTAVAQEIFDEARELCAAAGMTLEFTNLPVSVFTIMDRDRIERAIYNLLSNSLKYAAPGSTISASLTRRKNTLYLTVSDTGAPMDPGISATAFTRYLREPGIEDGRHGIGLGLKLVHSIATAHGGTVLMEPSRSGGVRITIGLPIRQSGSGVRSSPLVIDYAGEHSHSLIELSESLPHQLFAPHPNK